jgi:peptidoglycan-N-acetylglucosamine deacetylase
VKRLPLPGLVLILSTLGFCATWVAAPRESLSGSAALPDRPATRSPLPSAAQALPPPAPVPARRPHPLFAISQPFGVALTFDDGPHHTHTTRLLEVLASHRVQATFFVNGSWLRPEYRHAQRNREVLTQTFRAGHSIGNHGYHHVNFGRLPHPEQTFEIVANEQVIESVTGARPYFFRAPYGVLPRHAASVLRERDYVAVRWNAAVADEEQREPKQIRDAVMSWLRHYEGGIVMLHDRNRATVEATDLILRSIAAENARRQARQQPIFRVVPLDSFLQPPAESGAF